jgi:DNA-binding response OmpR family regulator
VAKPFSTETLLAAVDAVLGPGDEESAASPAEELAPAAV